MPTSAPNQGHPRKKPPTRLELLAEIARIEKERSELERMYELHLIECDRERRAEEKAEQRIRAEREEDWREFHDKIWPLMTPGVRVPLPVLERLWNEFLANQRAKGNHDVMLQWKKDQAVREYAETLEWYAKRDRERAEQECREDPRYSVGLYREMLEELIIDMIRNGVFKNGRRK